MPKWRAKKLGSARRACRAGLPVAQDFALAVLLLLLAFAVSACADLLEPAGNPRRRREGHSAAPPSPFSRRFNMDGEESVSRMTASPTARQAGPAGRPPPAVHGGQSRPDLAGSAALAVLPPPAAVRGKPGLPIAIGQ